MSDAKAIKNRRAARLSSRMSFWLVLVAGGAFYANNAASLDWPQWQGIDRTAISKERNLLQEWPSQGPPLKWKANGLGGGDSTPSIAAGVIYGMSNRGRDEVVWAISEADGKPIWTSPIGPAYNQEAIQSKEGPASTPTIDGDRLYAIGMEGDLVCLQVKDGKVMWRSSMTKDFGGTVPIWSYRESPLIDGNKVICTPGGRSATMVALDKMTGKTIWKSVVPGAPGGAYASAIAIDFEGQRQYVQLTSKALVGVSAADGKFLWRYDAPANSNGITCSTPVYHNGHVFAASAYGAGGGLVKLTSGAGGAVKATEVYFSKRMQNHHGGMVLHDGCLYGANGGNEGGALVCLDFMTGKVLWDQRSNRRQATPKGSIAMADNRIYYRTEDGTVVLIEPSRDRYIERGRFEQPNRTNAPAWAHPVIANGSLYIRDQDTLYCYDVRAK